MKVILVFLALSTSLHSHAQVLANVGDSKITTEEFNRKLEAVRKQTLNPPAPNEYLEELIRFEMGVKEAEKEKLQDDPVVKDRYRQVLYNALLEKQLGKKIEDIKVTESEMKEYYKKNPEIRLAHILIEIKENAKPEEREVSRKRAHEILDEVKKSKRPFEDLVRLHTDDFSTKDIGGDIGFQSKSTLSARIYDTAMGMKPNDVKGLVETPFGFHIIKFLEKRSYDLADKRQLRAALLDEKREKVFNDYFDKLKKNYKIEVNRETLKGIKN